MAEAPGELSGVWGGGAAKSAVVWGVWGVS